MRALIHEISYYPGFDTSKLLSPRDLEVYRRLSYVAEDAPLHNIYLTVAYESENPTTPPSRDIFDEVDLRAAVCCACYAH